jgi:Holliday junction resolvase
MKEQDIQRKIIKWLEANDCYVVKVVAASKSGVPDIIGCWGGIFFGIEVKTPKTAGNVSRLQEYNLDRIRECGGHSCVAWSVEQVEDFIKGLTI